MVGQFYVSNSLLALSFVYTLCTLIDPMGGGDDDDDDEVL